MVAVQLLEHVIKKHIVIVIHVRADIVRVAVMVIVAPLQRVVGVEQLREVVIVVRVIVRPIHAVRDVIQT